MVVQAIVPLSRMIHATRRPYLPASLFAIFEHIDYVCKSIFKHLRPPIVTSRADAGTASQRL